MKHGVGPDADPAAKRRALLDLRYDMPFVSARALAAICKWAKAKGGLPECESRNPMRKVRDDICKAVTGPYGTLHKLVPFATVTGEYVRVEIANPWAYLHEILSASPSIAGLVTHLLQQDGYRCSWDSPWSLVLYSDEITPGNQVSHKNSRKTWAIYYSFLEFGPALASEDYWFTGTLVSSDVVKSLDGGWSAVCNCRLPS